MKRAVQLCLVWALAACGGGDSAKPHADAGSSKRDAAPNMDASNNEPDDAGSPDAGMAKPPNRVCSPDNFCWELPTPQGETLRGVWAAAADDVWAVADGGGLMHFDGTGFHAEHADTQQDLLAIHGTGPRDIWAVGKGGHVLHYDGSQWSREDLTMLFDASAGAMTGVLYGVFAAAPDAVWAVGHSGVSAIILHYDGKQWSNQSLGLQTDQALRAVWGTGRDKLWAVGDMGVIRSFDGMQWKVEKSPTTSALFSVHALAPHDVWAVGANGAAARWNGTAWASANMGLSGALSSVRVDIAAAPPVMDAGMMAPKPPDAGVDAGPDTGIPQAPQGPWSVWAFGEKGRVFRYNGTLWVALPSGTTLGYGAAARITEGKMLAVGERGLVMRFDGDSRQPLSSATRNNHLALWGDGKTLWAVGDDIARRDDSGWNTVMRISERSLYGVWGDTNAVWAVGTAGSIVRYQNGMAKLVESAAAADSWLHAIAGAGKSVWIVGDAGLALTSAAGGFIKVMTPARSNLLDVWGNADDQFWAVGEGGTVLRWDGMNWLKVPTGAMGGTAQNLRAVWGSAADDVWVVGTEATILHWNGTRFEARSPSAHYALNDVWGRSKSEVYAVGSGGVALRYDGNEWKELKTGTRSSLQSVFGDERGRVFVAGLDGVVLVLEPH